MQRVRIQAKLYIHHIEIEISCVTLFMHIWCYAIKYVKLKIVKSSKKK